MTTTTKSARCLALGAIQYFFGCGVGSVVATLNPGYGYAYAISDIVMILVIIFAWPFIGIRLVERGWIKP